ncbi:hypothetical protein LTR94_025623 [Friedmanniomyces endolithicus]|nr:hypothetical protein LTR94_025623 [Friedmanniomyces endolithicus]
MRQKLLQQSLRRREQVLAPKLRKVFLGAEADEADRFCDTAMDDWPVRQNAEGAVSTIGPQSNKEAVQICSHAFQHLRAHAFVEEKGAADLVAAIIVGADPHNGGAAHGRAADHTGHFAHDKDAIEQFSISNSPDHGQDWHGTTILAVRKNGRTVIAGDGQVSMGPTIVKGAARKVRTLAGGKVLAGFAGATADAFTLIERLEGKLEQYPDQLARACVDLAKDWRTDRYLRRLEAMLLVADRNAIFTVTGVGDVLEPEYGVAAVGSGGNYALSAARALIEETDLDAEAVARKAMKIAAEICVYTNGNLTVESLEA